MSKEKYHVTQREDGKWQGKQQGANRASVVANTKKEAMNRTIEIAKKKDDAQVFIHGRDGKIQEERTYGNDPSKTPG